MNGVTATRVRELLVYDRDTGIFTRRIPRPGYKAGTVAGSLDHYGYVTIMVDGAHYKAHRLAWLYEHGEWPAFEIDHRDGDKANNRFCNLRNVPTRVNVENKRVARADNKTGVLGVCVKKGRFVAQLQVRGEKLYLGAYATAEEAHAAYLRAKRAHHDGCSL